MSAPGFIVSHAGRQHSYRVAAAIQAAGLLRAFLTSGYYKRGRFPDRLAASLPVIDRSLTRRWHPGIDPGLVRRFPWLELPEVAYRALMGNDQRARRLMEWRDVAFDKRVSALLPSLGGRGFWGFQGSCRDSLSSCQALGITSVAEFASVPAAVVQALLRRDEVESGVALEASPAIRDSEYDSRAAQEPLHADICVAASSFGAQSLQQSGVPADRIRVIPLGVDVREFMSPPRFASFGSLRVLFVGKLGRHKGLRYLVSAMARLASRNVSLTLVGPGMGEDLKLGSAKRVNIVGALRGPALLRAYAEHDVLVLPSLYEGFGLVILEAMACGLPVVATANSCAPDVLREGIDGFVVPAFDSDAIATRLELLAGHPTLRAQMGRQAAERATQFSWERHSDRVGEFARVLMGAA